MDDSALLLELVVLALCQFASSLSLTVCGLGGAMIFTVGWNLGGVVGMCPGTMMEVALYTSLGSMIACFIQAYVLRQHFSWAFVVLVSVLWIATDYVGSLLLIEVGTSVWYKRSLGVMLLLIFFWETTNHWTASVTRALLGDRGGSSSVDADGSPAKAQTKFSLLRRRDAVWSVCLGVGSGFLRGLFNVPLIALMIFALHSGMPKHEWRSNSGVISFVTVLPKMYFLFVTQHQFKSDHWPQYVTCIAGSVFALPLGNYIAARVEQESFRQIILFVLFFGALLLATHDTGVISLFSIVTLAGVGALGFLVFKWRNRSRNSPVAKPAQNTVAEHALQLPDAAVIGNIAPERRTSDADQELRNRPGSVTAI